MPQNLKKRFSATRIACGKDDAAIEARYTRLDGQCNLSIKPRDFRLPSEKDRDRLVYAYSFRRLGEITQVIPRERGCLLHNRLTHTLKVAQLARRIAERLLSADDGFHHNETIDLANELGGLDPNVVETAALAHDLGHPPFGHIIEEFLDSKIKGEASDGFEGNAQTFRIITYLEGRHVDSTKDFGLNLTYASLNATIKYPWQRDVRPKATGKRAHKYGYYSQIDPDKEHFKKVRAAFDQNWQNDRRSLEAEIMDWADDIAYAVYDIEDFYRGGLIPLDKLLKEAFNNPKVKAHEDSENEWSFFYTETRARWESQGRDQKDIDALSDSFAGLQEFLRSICVSPKGLDSESAKKISVELLPLFLSYRATHAQRHACALLTSGLVERFVNAIALNEKAITNQVPRVSIDPESKKVVSLLKELTWTYIIDVPDLHAMQHGHRCIVETVFDELEQAPTSDINLLPRTVRDLAGDDLFDGPKRRRSICDIISSMTEAQIMDLYVRLSGVSPGSLLRNGYPS